MKPKMITVERFSEDGDTWNSVELSEIKKGDIFRSPTSKTPNAVYKAKADAYTENGFLYTVRADPHDMDREISDEEANRRSEPKGEDHHDHGKG